MRLRTVVVLFGLLAMVVSLAPEPALAQQTQKRSEVEFMPVAPAPERIYRPWDPYVLSFALEVGGQVATVDGNHTMYDAHQNYGDGFKVFTFNLRGKGQDGALFSDFFVEGGGWGVNEPYSWTRFGFSKDKWFDFKGKFRQSEYNWFFPGFARSQHFDTNQRRLQNYDLTLLPQRRFRVKLGYRRNSIFGPTLTSGDFSRGEFPQFEPLRRTYDEYTLGAEWNISRWLVVANYGYRFFRHDRFITLLTSPTPPNDPGDAASLNIYDRYYPARGKIPFVRLNLAGRPHNTLEVNARLAYSRAKTIFTRSEFRDGTTYSQGPAVPSVAVTETFSSFGSTTRPLTTFDGNVTWRPVRQLTLTNNFQYRGYDIAGFHDEAFDRTCGATSASCVPGSFGELFSTLFDLDTFTDRFEARYDFNRWLAVRGGVTYTDRQFRFFEYEDGLLEHSEELDFLNRSYLFGVVLRPQRRISLFFDGEKGSSTRVFTRLSPADIDRYRLRGRFEPVDGVKISASWFIFDNSNFELPTSFNPGGRHSSRNRGFSVDFQLSRFQRGYLNIGYSRNDVTALTDVTIPGFGPPQGGLSIYILNDNYFYVDVGGRISGKLYADGGYRLTDSSGTFPASDPTGACVPFVPQSCDNTGGLDPLGIFDGGLKYHQPHLGVRYAFSDNVSWKAGWRYYDYNQQGGTFSDYDAHVVTTSLVLNF